MESKFSNELTVLAARLMLCESKKEILNISNEFGKLIERVIEQEEKAYTPCAPSTKSVTATIKFTKQEVAPMAETLKRDFIANGFCARIIKRESGEKKAKTYIYEIRYRRNGYNISASSKDLAEAKRRFIEATKPENLQKYYVGNKKQRANARKTVLNVGVEWLNSKKGDIDERTFRDYKMNCEKRIFPYLGDKLISEIRTNDIKTIISAASGRVIETLQTIFNGIMFYALANGDITFNPMQAIKFKKVKRNKRRALTAEEQQTFLRRIDLPEFSNYRPYFLLQYYFGLRPWELTDVRFEGDFLIALNAKHEDHGEPVYKKIPIPKQLKAKLDTTKDVICPHRTDVLNRVFKRIMQDENVTQYYLRHTFASVCQQYVRPDIVDIWMGDSSERLVGRVYTHFSDDFMIEQMNNVIFYM